MPFVIDEIGGGMYESPRRPWVKWGPAEQAKNLREALGGELDDELTNLVKERIDAGECDPYP